MGSDKRYTANSVSLLSRETVAADEAGDLTFSAVLKVFNRPNANGEVARPDAYDAFITARPAIICPCACSMTRPA